MRIQEVLFLPSHLTNLSLSLSPSLSLSLSLSLKYAVIMDGTILEMLSEVHIRV